MEERSAVSSPENPSETLPLSLLNRVILDASGDLPLHAQLRRGLQSIIEKRCDDGQKFYTEPQLIQHLRVSQSTVRRALLDLAREGLLLRRVAKGSFVRKRTPVVAQAFTVNVFLPEWSSGFLVAMLKAFYTECKRKNWRMRSLHTHQGDNFAENHRMVEGKPEQQGIILLANESSLTLGLTDFFHQQSYQVVNIDCLIPDYPGPFVGTDNQAVVQIALDHLVGLGHERIAFFINEPEEHGNVIERARLFEEEAARRGLTRARVFHCSTHFYEDSYEAAYRKMPELMNGPHRPTAIFAMSDPGAWAALKWLAEKRIKVPEEVSVLGFSDDRPSRFTHPGLTTIAHPVGEIAATALRLFTEPPDAEARYFLPPRLVLRDSTAEARR